MIEAFGRGGGQMVSVLAFHSNDPSLNAAESTVFLSKIAWKNEKEAKSGLLKTVIKANGFN